MKTSIQLFKHFKINLFVFPVVIASLFYGYFIELAIAFAIALLHEISHIISAKIFKVKISYIEILPFGVSARLESNIIENPTYEIIIAFSGPLSNILLALIFYFISDIRMPYASYITICSTAMALINLLPVLPLDGGRIMRAYITKKLGAFSAYSVSIKISRVFIILILGSSVLLLLNSSFNFSYILIGVFLLGNLLGEQNNITRLAVIETASYKEKLKKHGLIRTYVITVDESAPARRILKRLSYDRYHIVCVSDKNFKIKNILTEGEIIHALFENGIRTKFGDI